MQTTQKNTVSAHIAVKGLRKTPLYQKVEFLNSETQQFFEGLSSKNGLTQKCAKFAKEIQQKERAAQAKAQAVNMVVLPK